MEGNTIQQPLSKYLIIDTAGFIKNPPLQEFGQNLITLREVIDEIRDKETKQRLKALPYELQFLEPDSEAIKIVSDFSRKTGDFASLSATDIKVLALTYMLEVRHVGIEHLLSEPKISKTVEFYQPGGLEAQNHGGKLPVGFVTPIEDEENEDEEQDTDEIDEEEDDEDAEHEVDHGSDDEGWITPSNFKSKKLEMLGVDSQIEEEEKEIIVACLTSDFAMQNVLKQMGLHTLSADGIIIKEAKTWILRCYACFKTTTRMELKFCPNCGNKTLKRVSMTLNKDGSQQIHISTRKPLSNRGKKFSLPKPKGGKYAVNPILSADQPIPQQKRSSMAIAKTNALNEDYTAGNAPFAKHDVTSKSAMLGIGHGGNQYWSHKNPNAVGRRTGNRKKKNN